MHLELLVEDQSGKAALEILLPKMVARNVTYRIIDYKGIGHLPKNINRAHDASKRVLLNTLPKLIRGVGKTFAAYPEDYPAALIVVCDLDNKDLTEFMNQLNAILNACDPKPLTRFCLAIEEGEAWLLGDLQAIVASYPRCKKTILDTYINDSICGTWELLADAVYPGGHEMLKKKGWQAVGAEKSKWSRTISPLMDVHVNKSPSFKSFLIDVRELIEEADS